MPSVSGDSHQGEGVDDATVDTNAIVGTNVIVGTTVIVVINAVEIRDVSDVRDFATTAATVVMKVAKIADLEVAINTTWMSSVYNLHCISLQ